MSRLVLPCESPLDIAIRPDSNLDDLQRRIELSEITRIGGHDSLTCTTGAQHYMSIRYVRRAAGGKQTANADCIGSVQWDDGSVRRSQQPRQPHLTVRSADDLRQRRRRDRDGRIRLVGAGQQRNDRPLASLKCDQASSIEHRSQCHTAVSASERTSTSMGIDKHLVRPCAFFGSERSTRLFQRLSQGSAPGLRIVKGRTDGALHERRDAR